mmetsp:Transcript_62687/g.136285  ORF Transcript_62687/g.136285 Transcript_62687/m.136285 type:complete len:104 (-) Transcript_62687:564-875(-)
MSVSHLVSRVQPFESNLACDACYPKLQQNPRPNRCKWCQNQAAFTGDACSWCTESEKKSVCFEGEYIHVPGMGPLPDASTVRFPAHSTRLLRAERRLAGSCSA